MFYLEQTNIFILVDILLGLQSYIKHEEMLQKHGKNNTFKGVNTEISK